MPRSSSSVSRGSTSAYSQGDQSEDYGESFTVECISAGLSILQHIAPSGISRRVCWIPGQGGTQHLVRWASGRQDVDRCIGGRARLPESDPELTAMVSQAAESIKLHWRPPSSPKRSRLEDWFPGAQAARRQLPPVPFFPEVHEEVTRSWRAPFSARNRASSSSILTALDVGAAKRYVEIPPVERTIVVQLCPQSAAAWWDNPRLLSRARGFSFVSMAEAYIAAGQAASALHAMALLHAYQAKALKQLHEGSSNPGLMQELHTVTNLALHASKVTARSLGQTMCTQERHLWLNLADKRESDKHCFLDSPISKAGLFGDAVESLAQFSATQKWTEVIRQQSLPRRPTAVATLPPAAALPPARGRGRHPAAYNSDQARPQQQPSSWPQRSGAACLCPCQAHEAPKQAAFLGWANPRHWILLFRRW